MFILKIALIFGRGLQKRADHAWNGCDVGKPSGSNINYYYDTTAMGEFIHGRSIIVVVNIAAARLPNIAAIPGVIRSYGNQH